MAALERMTTTAMLRATPQLAERISQLVHASFIELSAADWEPDARAVFLAESAPASIANALRAPAFAAVEELDATLVGFILIRKPTILDMLFVHPSYLRQGVARRLWTAARHTIQATFADVESIELNATPYSVDAYRSLGFYPVSEPFTRDRCRATRLACPLSCGARGASAL